MKLAISIALMVVPAALFYSILWKNVVRVPFLDDYDVVLGTLIRFKQNPGLSRLFYVTTYQWLGYKVMLANAMAILQLELFGRANFVLLNTSGNVFALLIFLLVLSMSRAAPADIGRRCLLLVPVAWLIFQLQYASALNFYTSSLTHLSVVFFSLLSIYLLAVGSQLKFSLACAALILAIASLPNGFFVVPVGLLILAQNKAWWRIPIWLASATLMLMIYFFHYHQAPTEVGSHPNLIYALSFLGASAARFTAVATSVALGLFLSGVFLLAAKLRYFRKNPPVFYSMLFILISAVAVSSLRADMGVTQSLASRYRTYSNLFLAFSYLFLTEEILPRLQSRVARRAVLGGVLTFSIIFCLMSDLAGARFLRGRKEALTHTFQVEWLGEMPGGAGHLNPADANPVLLRQIDAGIYSMKLPILRKAIALGVYVPPATP